MNIMKVCAICAVLLLGGVAVARSAQDDAMQQQALAKEKQELDCLKTGNYQEFAGLIADDAVFMAGRGSAGKAEVVANTHNVRLTDYSMSNIRFVRVSDSAELVLYQLDESGTIRGQAFAEKVNVSALWAKRDGKWVCLFSQETAAR